MLGIVNGKGCLEERFWRFALSNGGIVVSLRRSVKWEQYCKTKKRNLKEEKRRNSELKSRNGRR